MKTTKKVISILLSIVVILGCVLPAMATETEIKTIIDASVEHLYSKNEQASYGNEWAIMAIASGEYEVSENYYNDYVTSIIAQMDANGGKLSQSTDYSRVIMALSAIGLSPKTIGNYNLLETLADYNFVTNQGLNGPVYALLALDSANYEIPQAQVTELATRQKYVDYILDSQVSNG
ncbi:MAG: hypothetical protein IKV58_00900, partial [Oscillospiraceae bacterium]|nr:hypothetical protein [Oscillospiraceae bacterium]